MIHGRGRLRSRFNVRPSMTMSPNSMRKIITKSSINYNQTYENIFRYNTVLSQVRFIFNSKRCFSNTIPIALSTRTQFDDELLTSTNGKSDEKPILSACSSSASILLGDYIATEIRTETIGTELAKEAEITEAIAPSTSLPKSTTTYTDYTSSIEDYIAILSKTIDDPKPYEVLLQKSYKKLKPRKERTIANSEITEYKTFEGLAEASKTSNFVQVYDIVHNSYLNGNYLTPNEFEQIVKDTFEHKPIAYAIVKLYSTKYDPTAFTSRSLASKMLILTSSQKDYQLFDGLFVSYMSLVKGKPGPGTLLTAIRFYLGLSNITMATQLFNQSVMMASEEYKTRPKFLHTYLKDLKLATMNPSLCYMAYRLWQSKDMEINTETDVMLFMFLRGRGSEEQFRWFSGMLKRKQRDCALFRVLVELKTNMDSLESLNEFYSSGTYEKWLKELEMPEKKILYENLFDIHLKLGDYNKVSDRLQIVPNKSYLRINKVLTNLVEKRQPRVLVKLLIKLHNDSGLVIRGDHITDVWIATKRKYPQLTIDIDKKFNKFISCNSSKMFAHFPRTINSRNDTQSDPAMIQEFSPKSKRKSSKLIPNVNTIEAKIRAGIVPTTRTVITAIRYTNDVNDFNNLLSIVKNYPKLIDSNDCHLQTEIFWRHRALKTQYRQSLEEFLDNFSFGNNTKNNARPTELSFNQLLRLLHTCSKLYQYDIANLILDEIVKSSPPPSDQIWLKFAYHLIVLYSRQNKFRELIILLEHLKTNTSVQLTPYFLDLVAQQNRKYTTYLFNKTHMDNNSEDEKLVEDNGFSKEQLYSEIVRYLNGSIEELRAKCERQRLDVLNEVDGWLTLLEESIKDDEIKH